MWQWLFVFTFLGIYLYIGWITWDDVILYGSWLIAGTTLGVFMCWIGFSFGEVARRKEHQIKRGE